MLSHRTPVLATTGLDGVAQARTVVLREVRRTSEQLLIYTDARSPKVAELLAQPLASNSAARLVKRKKDIARSLIDIERELMT